VTNAMTKIQDSRTLMVTYTYRMCSEMKKWRCPAECATEQIQITRDSNVYTIYNLYSKRSRFVQKKILKKIQIQKKHNLCALPRRRRDTVASSYDVYPTNMVVSSTEHNRAAASLALHPEQHHRIPWFWCASDPRDQVCVCVCAFACVCVYVRLCV